MGLTLETRFRSGRPDLPALRFKNEGSMRDLSARCNTKDFDLSWTPFQGPAHRTRQASRY